jgi:signal-transduction protein with cAMP-binding, CBS, and nucleotidyltransferase domain
MGPNRPTLRPMPIDNLVAPLLRVPLFAGLKGSQLTEIAQRAERASFSPGGTLVEAGQPGDGAFLVVSGIVDRLAGPGPSNGAARERVGPGTLIGEMAMLIEHTHAATFVAVDRVFCLKLTRAGMHAHMRRDAAMIEHFERRITERLTRMSEELRQVESALAAKEVEPAELAQPVHATPMHVTPVRFVAASRHWR